MAPRSRPDAPTTLSGSRDDPLERLGYLLAAAHARYLEIAGAALAPLGISVLDWAAMLRFDDGLPRSQAEIARLLGIDRTSMVALVDRLESRGLVRRQTHDADRRKNVVVLSAAGRRLETRAAGLIERCEREFLRPLSATQAAALLDTLRAALTGAA